MENMCTEDDYYWYNSYFEIWTNIDLYMWSCTESDLYYEQIQIWGNEYI